MLCSRAAAGEIGGAAVAGHISAASTLVTALLRSDRPFRGVTHTCRRVSCRSLYRPALVTLQVTRPPRGAGLGAARGAWLTPVRPPDTTAAPTGPLSRSPVPSPPGTNPPSDRSPGPRRQRLAPSPSGPPRNRLQLPLNRPPPRSPLAPTHATPWSQLVDVQEPSRTDLERGTLRPHPTCDAPWTSASPCRAYHPEQEVRVLFF